MGCFSKIFLGGIKATAYNTIMKTSQVKKSKIRKEQKEETLGRGI